MKRYLLLALIAATTLCAAYYISTSVSSSAKKLSLKEDDDLFGYDEDEDEENERDRPDLAAAQEFEMTKDPALGYPPTERKIEAFATTKKLLKSRGNLKAIENVNWVERGPDNVGGRTRALLYDPNDPSGKRVWAGAVAGGIWYNDDITDNTSVWHNVDDFMSNIAISTMAYDPNSTNIFYAGTGLVFSNDVKGAGIWKSEDGGNTWSHLSSTDPANSNDFDYTQQIVVTSNSKVIAGTLSGIQVSTDEGANWTETLNKQITDIDLASDGTIYASDYSGNIYKSIDEGENWATILSGEGGFRVELASAPSDPNTVYAVSEASSRVDVGYFKKTTNGGDTWTDITIPNYFDQNCQESNSDFTRGQAFYDLILGVYPNDANRVIVGGIDLFRSNNGGTDWELLTYWTGACADYVHADQHALTFKDNTTAVFGNDGGVYYSENLDASDPDFFGANKGYNTVLFYSCAAANEPLSDVYLAGAQDNGTQKFANPGINSTVEASGGDGAYCFIDQDDPDVMIASYVFNVYKRSLDGGNSFSTFSNDQNNGRFINPADYDDDTDILYAAHGANAMIVYSNISGASVNSTVKSISIGGDRLSHLRTSPYTENRLFVGNSSGGVYIIDNANTSPQVTRIDAGALPAGYISCVEVGETDDHLLVTLSNYGVASVWETIDGGDHWVNKEGASFPDMPVRWALFNPQNRREVLLATEFGIWSTDDITANDPEWEPTVEGLANVKCNMLQYRESDQQVIVATFGRGLYTTNAFSTDVYAEFKTSQQVAYPGSSIVFDSNVTGKVNNYTWDFGDGTSSTQANPVHAYTAPGTYDVKLSVNDGSVAKLKKANIVILPNREGNYTLSQGGDFDTFEDDFRAINISGTSFELGNSDIQEKSGTVSGDNAWVTGIDEANYQDNSLAYLYSPHFDLSTAGTYELSFKTKYKFEENWEGFIVEYTLDSGKTWSKLNEVMELGWYNAITESQSVFGPSVPIFSGSTNGNFVEKSTDISSLSGSGRVGFRIVFRSDSNTTEAGMALDNFQISGPQSNASPDFVSTPVNGNICEGTTITFYDQSVGSVDSYTWNFGDGATPASATGRGPHVVTYSTTGSKDINLTIEGALNGTQSELKNNFITITGNPIEEKSVAPLEEGICLNQVASIIVTDSDPGFGYQLFNATDNSPVSAITEGNAGDLTFETEELAETTSFYVVVNDLNSTCSTILSDQPTVEVLGPHVRDIFTNDKDVCANSEVEFTVTNAEVGITYRIFDITNQEFFSDEFVGADEDLVVSSYPLVDTVELKVIAESASCSLESESVIINARPLPEATITEADLILTASDGLTYQWYLNGEIIAGENDQTISPAQLGEYSVEVNSNGCSAFSDPFTVTVLAVNDYINMQQFKVYPNPTEGQLHIDQQGDFNKLKIYDLTGVEVYTQEFIFQNEVIMLNNLKPGQYILELIGQKEDRKVKIIKY